MTLRRFIFALDAQIEIKAFRAFEPKSLDRLYIANVAFDIQM
jgi:hypothetical protein